MRELKNDADIVKLIIELYKYFNENPSSSPSEGGGLSNIEITNDDTATEEDSKVLNAVQNNPNVEGTLANQLKEQNVKIESLKYRTMIGEELSYGTFGLSENYTNNTEGAVIPFNNKYSGNIECTDEGYIKLFLGKTYKIECKINGDFSNIAVGLYDATTGDLLQQANGCHMSGKYNYESNINFIYTPKSDDTKICIKYITDYVNDFIMINSYLSYVTITEVGRSVIVNEVQQINEQYGLEDGSVGDIKGIFSDIAPKHYLKCDGAIYKISDYPFLAKHFKDRFGRCNIYGGDGITTFAVPDARGEFLRGYDPEAIRDPQGATRGLGSHQDGTVHKIIATEDTHTQIRSIKNGTGWDLQLNKDGDYVTNGNLYYSHINQTNYMADIADKLTGYYSRPTNINVLWCIKYEPTYFMNYYPTYGYMDKKILLNNIATDVDKIYTLEDSINKYDMLIVEGKIIMNSTTVRKTSIMIVTDDIEYNDVDNRYIISVSNVTGSSSSSSGWQIQFIFRDERTFIIKYVNSNGYSSSNILGISKITGIRTTKEKVNIE